MQAADSSEAAEPIAEPFVARDAVKHLENGEVVNLDALKAKRLVSRNAGRIKILARGIMTKKLTVYADKFSLQAVKMITLAGGTANQYK